MSTITDSANGGGGAESPETVLVAGGQDWDQIVDAARNADPGERIVVNMGPSTRPPTGCCG